MPSPFLYSSYLLIYLFNLPTYLLVYLPTRQWQRKYLELATRHASDPQVYARVPVVY